jgi:hypothetical protein
MSFFVTDTKLNLRKTEQFIFNGLILAIFLGISGYSAIVIMNQFAPKNMSNLFVSIFSCITVMISLFFNLYLAGVRSAYTDEELMTRWVKEETDNLASEKKALVKQAHEADQVDGVPL